ncbi:MAG: F0F1 ATP synthase subunit A [Breznakia sp.]
MNADGLLIQIGDFEFFVHQSIVIWFAICIITGVVLAIAGQKFKKADPSIAPKGVLLIFEIIVGLCYGVIHGNLHAKTWKYLPSMGTVMILMVLSNMMGLFGLQPPTSNISLTITLVFMFIGLVHITELKRVGVRGKLKEWCEPIPLLMPLNIVGDIALPISLSLRLFGNMLGGTIIIALLYLMISSLLPYSGIMLAITPFLHMYFDIFVAFIQTYIFFMLTSYFLNDSLGGTEEE